MFQHKSFLRRLPVALDLNQRLAIGALVYAADAMTHSFDRLREITTRLGKKILSSDNSETTGLFIHAWSMVDHLHVIRQLMKSLLGSTFENADSADVSKSYAKEARDFYLKYETATILRNRMDHLTQNIPNLANSKTPRPPVFGVISYLLIENHNFRIVDGRRVVDSAAIVTINSGAFTQAHSFPMLNPAGRVVESPVSLFQLAAFDEVLTLSDAMSEMRPVLAAIENEIEKSCKASAEAAAMESGMPIDKWMGNAGGGLTMVVEIKFEPQAIIEKASFEIPQKCIIPKQP